MIHGRQVLDDQAVGTTGDSFSREPMYRGVLEKELADRARLRESHGRPLFTSVRSMVAQRCTALQIPHR